MITWKRWQRGEGWQLQREGGPRRARGQGASEGGITQERGGLQQALWSGRCPHPGHEPPDSPSHREEGLPENKPGLETRRA